MPRGRGVIMNKTPADILESAANFDEFREGIAALSGCFPLDREEMLRLGKVYFQRYPDSSPDRIMENVHTGYKITRTCLIEKLIEGIEERHRDTVRGMLDDFRFIDAGLAMLEREIGIEEIESIVYVIECNLDRLRNIIEELPKGMIKERFVGGISKFFNDVYLINLAVKRIKGQGEEVR